MTFLEKQIKYYTKRQKEAKENFKEFQKNRKVNKDGSFTKMGIAKKRIYNSRLQDYKATTFHLMNYHNEKIGKEKIEIPEFEKYFQEQTGVDPKMLK